MWLLLWMACGGDEPPPADPAGTEPTAETGGTATTGETGTTVETGVRPPNVLIVLTDDQGIDKVSSYDGHPSPPPTPVIDSLAARGVSFDRAYAHPICSPSRAALLTGKLGQRTGLGGVIQFLDDEELPPETYSLPRMLEASPHAWAKAAYGKWHISSYVSASGIDHPLQLGFDAYAGNLTNINDAYLTPGANRTYTSWDKVEDGKVHLETTYATTDTVDDVLEAVAVLPEPWLLYVPMNAPHTPLHVPPEELAGPVDDLSTANLYDAAVQALDAELGRMLEGIDPDDTLVIFASDNGTSHFGVREPLDPQRAKLTPYEGGIRVPLIVAGPGVAQGVRSDAMVHLVDVLPTVAEVAEVDLMATGEAFDGQSLWPFLRDPDAPGREFVHGERFLPNGQGEDGLTVDWWISHGPRFKVVGLAGGVEQVLFDLETDPEENVPYLSPDELPEALRDEARSVLDAQRAYFEGQTIPTW